MYAFTKNGQDLGFREALDLFELRTRRLKFLIQRLPIRNRNIVKWMVDDLVKSFHDKYITEIEVLTYPRKVRKKDVNGGAMCGQYQRCLSKLANILDPYYYDQSKIKKQKYNNHYYTWQQAKRDYKEHTLVVDSQAIDRPLDYDKNNMDFEEWQESIQKTFPYEDRKTAHRNLYESVLEEHTNDHYTYQIVKEILNDYRRLNQQIHNRGDFAAFDKIWDIHNALNALTEKEKLAIYLRYCRFQTFKVKDIATMWNTSEPNVSQIIDKAIHKMVHALETGDYTPPKRGRKKKVA